MNQLHRDLQKIRKTLNKKARPASKSKSRVRRAKSRRGAKRASVHAVSAKASHRHHAVASQHCRHNRKAPLLFTPQPRRMITTEASAARRIVVSAGNRLFLAFPPGGDSAIAGFQLPQSNLMFDNPGLFLTSGGADTAAQRSTPLTSTGSETWAFLGLNSQYALDASSTKATYQVPYSGTNPVSTVTGQSGVVSSTSDGRLPKMYLQRGDYSLSITTNFTGVAHVYASATDHSGCPNQTEPLTVNSANSSSVFYIRRPPGNPSNVTINAMTNSMEAEIVQSAGIKHMRASYRCVNPDGWFAGNYFASSTDNTNSTAEAGAGLYPQDNPFLAALMTGAWVVIDAMGADVTVQTIVNNIHAVEYQFYSGTDPVQAQFRASMMETKAHFSTNTVEAHQATMLPVGQVASGKTSEEAAAKHAEKVTSKAGVPKAPEPIVAGPTRVLDPPLSDEATDTTVEPQTEIGAEVAKTASDVVDTVGEVAEAGAEVYNTVKDIGSSIFSFFKRGKNKIKSAVKRKPKAGKK